MRFVRLAVAAFLFWVVISVFLAEDRAMVCLPGGEVCEFGGSR